MLDLINQLTGDIAPISIYLSIILTMMCTYHGIAFTLGHISHQNERLTREWHAARFRLLPNDAEIPVNNDIQNWIATKTKRIETPDDDDTDSYSFSIFISKFYYRGGKEWKNHLYSPV